MKKTVDAVITTHNRAEFITDALDSAVKQTFDELRIIIIDDGSNINVSAIISKYLSESSGLLKKKKRKIFYVYQRQRGISAARNTGIKLSRADYIAFIDDDDIWKKKKIERQIEELAANGLRVCYTDEIWYMNGKHLNQLKKHRKYSGDIFEKALPLCIISPSSILIERSVFSEIGFFDTSFEVCEDYEFWLRLTLHFEVFFLEEKLIIKRGGHDSQLSRKYPAMDRFRIEAIKKLIDNVKMPENKYQAALNEIKKKIDIYINGCLKREKKEEADYYILLKSKYI